MKRAHVDYPITNQYTFACVFSKPENARPLLEAVLGVPIGEIRNVDTEHTVEPSLKGKGVRMDVFVEDGSGTVYDVEMQNVDRGDLELRSRYLLSSFDRDRIVRGDDYLQLGKSAVIFVCGFDPVGLGDRMYVIRPAIVDRWSVYDDGTMRVLLNAAGAACESGATELQNNPRLASFLSYVDGGDTIDDEWVMSIDDEVRALNADKGWRNTMLGLQLDYQHERYLARQEGRADGLAEGRADGLAEGRAEGLAEGRAEGLAEGRAEGLAEGRADADRINRLLAEALSQAGRVDELVEALCEPETKARLLKEFGIS